MRKTPKVRKLSNSKKMIYKKPWAFNLIDSLISTISFVLCYWLWIINEQSTFKQLIFLILASLITGILGSIIARLLTSFSGYQLNLQHWIKNFLIAVLYGFLVWIGFISYLFSWFDLTNVEGWFRLIIVFLILKVAIVYLCDDLSDSITFKASK